MKCIIQDIDTLKKYVGNITSGATWENFIPEIEAATLEYILPFVGEKFHEEVLIFNMDSDDDTKVEYKIVQKIKAALANYAALKYMPGSDTFFTSQGLQTIKSENQVGAFAYQKADRMNKYAATADLYMDSALALIESVNGSLFRPAEMPKTNQYIPSAPEFNKFYDIGNSRRTYYRMLPIMARVEILEIEPILGNFDLSSFEDPAKIADRYIKPALANITISRALYELKMRRVGDALQLCSFYDPSAKTESADLAIIDRIAQKCANDGNVFLTRLQMEVNRMNRTNPSVGFQNNINKKHVIIG